MIKERKMRINWEKKLEEFEGYLRERENSAATIEKYLRDIKTFRRYAEEEGGILNKNILLKYKEWLTENYRVSSANSMLVAMNKFLIFIGAGYLRVRRIKIQAQRFRDVDKEMKKEDFKMLVSEARKCGRSQLAMLMETICATGIRVSELRFFQVESVKKGMVKVCNKGKYRIVLLPEKLRKKLLIYMAKNGIRTGMIFCTRSGKAKDRSNIWKEMKNLARQSGICPEKVFPHNFRHLFARVFYKTTGNLVHLADLLGHSSLEVTRIYTSDGINEWRKDLEKMNLIEIEI